jgi:xylulokinase
MTQLLGVDLGTTTFKAVVYDEAGEVLAAARVAPPDAFTTIDGVRVDYWTPDDLWACFSGLVRDVVSQLSDPTIDALALAEIGLVGMPLDRHAAPLYPAVTWIEPNASLSHIYDSSGLRTEDVFPITGNSLNPIYPPAWIRWLSERVPGYADGMWQWVCYGDYLAYRLTGTLAMDFSMASQTITLDQSTLAYRPDLLEALGLAATTFPEPQPAGSPLGEVTLSAAQDTGLRAGTAVILGGADYLSGPYGAGFVDAGDVAINTGTWECVVICTDRPRLDPRLAAVGAICDPHVVAGRWTIRIENLVGSVAEWFRREIAIFEPRDLAASDEAWSILVERAESSPPGAGGVVFHPYVFGSYGPRLDEHARGAFVGLRGTTTQGDLARALFEGFNFHTRAALDAMAAATGETPGRVVCMGGATRNRFWMQNRADVLGREIEVTESPDVTSRGAAMIAGVGIGVFTDFAAAAQQLAPARYTISPDPGRAERYSELHRRVYQPLCDALVEIHAAIAEVGDPTRLLEPGA